MEERIRNRFHDQILAEAQQRYGIDPGNIEELGGFESFIYKFTRNDKKYVLRLGHSIRRSPELIHGEVDWINHLARGGAGVAKAVNSDAGNLVELIPDGQGEHFLATAFVWANGGFVSQMGGWTEQFMLNYGRLLGKIHALTKQYTVTDPAWRRASWDDPEMLDARDALVKIDPEAAPKLIATIEHLRTLPRNEDGYGMIHQDAHTGNLFVDEDGRITLFDFDDCVFGHFIYDIAMVLFYAVTNHPTPEQFMAEIWPPFWQGYQENNQLDPIWLSEIHPFLKLREMDLYAIIRRDIPDIAGDSWVAQFMNGRREKILAERPYLNFDFTESATNEN